MSGDGFTVMARCLAWHSRILMLQDFDAISQDVMRLEMKLQSAVTPCMMSLLLIFPHVIGMGTIVDAE